MVVFTTETRLKEISIRKVLGAKELLLLYLTSKNFILMLGIAAAIALPLTYLFFDRVAFHKMAHHAPIGFTDMVLGGSCILLIALVLITTQSTDAKIGTLLAALGSLPASKRSAFG